MSPMGFDLIITEYMRTFGPVTYIVSISSIPLVTKLAPAQFTTMPTVPGMPTGPDDPRRPGESPPTISIVMCIIVSILILVAIFVARRSSHRTDSDENPHRRLKKGSGGIGVNALRSLPLIKYNPDLMGQDFHHDGSTSPRGLSLLRGMDMAVGDSGVGDKPSRKAWRAFYPRIRHALLGKHKGRQPCTEDGDTTPLIQTCAICTDDFVRGSNVRRLPCGHFFHPPCIDPWLLNFGVTCPLCRANLRTLANANNQSEGCVAEPPRAMVAGAEWI